MGVDEVGSERAKQIASNTSGVKGVVDQLAVKSS